MIRNFKSNYWHKCHNSSELAGDEQMQPCEFQGESRVREKRPTRSQSSW